jgi:replication-associated recombination protein RarA
MSTLDYIEELNKLRKELEAKDKEIERLSNIIRAVDVASRRKLKDGETVYNILSAIQKILEAE